MSTRQELSRYRNELSGKSAEDVISWATNTFPDGKLLLATSFGAEDQVITEMAARFREKVRIFTLDTGRMFEETYDTMQRTIDHFKIRCEVYAPDKEELERMMTEHGPNPFFESVEKRKTCCQIRKLNPLRRALHGASAWICGLRRGQAVTRMEIQLIDWDEVYGLYKICPLCDWSEDDVWAYIRKKNIPYNTLHDRGFPSVGCSPCTRAIKSGEDVRAGRWWWENPEHRECGLHGKQEARGKKPE